MLNAMQKTKLSMLLSTDSEFHGQKDGIRYATNIKYDCAESAMGKMEVEKNFFPHMTSFKEKKFLKFVDSMESEACRILASMFPQKVIAGKSSGNSFNCYMDYIIHFVCMSLFSFMAKDMETSENKKDNLGVEYLKDAIRTCYNGPIFKTFAYNSVLNEEVDVWTRDEKLIYNIISGKDKEYNIVDIVNSKTEAVCKDLICWSAGFARDADKAHHLPEIDESNYQTLVGNLNATLYMIAKTVEGVENLLILIAAGRVAEMSDESVEERLAEKTKGMFSDLYDKLESANRTIDLQKGQVIEAEAKIAEAEAKTAEAEAKTAEAEAKIAAETKDISAKNRELVYKLKKEKEKTEALQKKLDELTTKYNILANPDPDSDTEEADSQLSGALPEIDYSKKYVFIFDEDCSSVFRRNVEENFPNAKILSTTKNSKATLNVAKTDMLIIMTSYVRHISFEKYRDICKNAGVPYVYCSEIAIDRIVDAIAKGWDSVKNA